MVERSLSMREVPGSMPGFSTLNFFFPLSFFSLVIFFPLYLPVSSLVNAPKIKTDTFAILIYFFAKPELTVSVQSG